MHLQELAATLRAPRAPPRPYLPFGSEEELPRGRARPGLTATFSGSSSTTSSSGAGAYVNTDSFAAAGDQFTPDTVLVLRVQVGDAGYLDPAGNPVPETKFTGTGAAMVFHRGRRGPGHLGQGRARRGLTLAGGGDAAALPAGKVWIELVPRRRRRVTVTR